MYTPLTESTLTKQFLIIHLRKRRRGPMDMTDFQTQFAPPPLPRYTRPTYSSRHYETQ